MKNSENYAYQECTYTVLVEYEDPSGKKRKKNVLDIRYPTEVYGGKICFPMIDPNAQDEVGKMMMSFYNETLS